MIVTPNRGSLFKVLLFAIMLGALLYYVVEMRPLARKEIMGWASDEEVAVPALAPADPATLFKADFFIDYRLERERVRGEQLELLREIINSPNTDETTRKEANLRWLRIAADIGRENEIENLLRAKGFEDAVAFIYDSAVVVVMKAKDLTQIEAARVAEIVTKCTGVRAEAISVIIKPQ
ncbi:MAG: SpoIIIAH-like family protein [Bacillota bacterium]